MTFMKANFAAILLLVTAVQACLGQDRAGDKAPMTAAGGQISEIVVSPDSLISRSDWKHRIEQARGRAEQGRREWRLNAPLRRLAVDPPDKVATQRVLNDDTLQPGDIVSTDKGLFVFRGRFGADGQATDFVPVLPRQME